MLTEIMAVSTVLVVVLLSVVCGVVVVGGWYLQSSLIQLQLQVMEQHYHYQEQTKHIEQLNKQIVTHNNQISELNIVIDILLNRNGKFKDDHKTNDNTSHHEIVKREQSQTTVQSDNTIVKLLHGRDGAQGKDGRDGAQGKDGRNGRDGVPGVKGDQGLPGLKGEQGSKGDQGLQGSKGEGRDGRDGRDGVQGIKGDVGPRGEKGDQGLTGLKGEPAGGLVYVRWGHDSCPSNGVQRIYSGRAAGSIWNQKGGGSNPQCLPLDPNYLRYQPGSQDNSFICGAEYQGTNVLVPNTHDTDVPCAVCYVPTRTALYMVPAKYTCPTGWTTEYYGYLMSERGLYHYRSQFLCIDHTMKTVIGSAYNHNGLLFYPVEGRCGSLPCPPYEEAKELTCVVCTK